jgi:hypothetical protein
MRQPTDKPLTAYLARRALETTLERSLARVTGRIPTLRLRLATECEPPRDERAERLERSRRELDAIFGVTRRPDQCDDPRCAWCAAGGSHSFC